MNKAILAALIVGLGVALGGILAFVAPEPKRPQAIEWLDNPRSLRNFRLDADAGYFDNQSIKGRWTIVVFGFLRCPDICPTSLSQMAQLADALSENALDQKVNFVFVSVDPGRDTVSEINQYVRHFHASIRGVTGEEDQLIKFTGDLGVRFQVTADEDNYSVAHSITYSIIDPEGFFLGRFRPGFDVSGLVQDFTSILTPTERI